MELTQRETTKYIPNKILFLNMAYFPPKLQTKQTFCHVLFAYYDNLLIFAKQKFQENDTRTENQELPLFS